MKKPFLWMWMLTKRLYRKPTFVVILLLIPLLVLGYTALTGEDSGMITVAMVRREDEPAAAAVMESMEADGQLLRFVYCQTAAEAEALVQAGKVDTAWILHEDFEENVARYVASPNVKNAFVTVLVREDSVALRLSREKLSGAMYSLCARAVYLNYVRQNVPGLDGLSDERLMEYYENTFTGSDLFVFDETDALMANAQNTHYLTAPIRGLLAVMVVLCGLATSMYYMEDQRRGTFSWLGRTGQSLAELGCQMVSLLNVAVMVLLTLAAVGMTAGWGRELLITVLYCLCTASFCALLRRLCRSLKVLGMLLPLLVVVMLLVCPVFYDLAVLRPAQYLLPPTYYIGGMYNNTYLVYMAVHTAVTSGLYWLLGLLKNG